VVTGNRRPPSASIELKVNGKSYAAAAEGVGPVDAALKAIQKVVGNMGIRLKEYRLEALNGNSDATADVTVLVEGAHNTTASGRGMRKDIVVGSVEAIVNGINVLLAKTEKEKPLAGSPRSVMGTVASHRAPKTGAGRSVTP